MTADFQNSALRHVVMMISCVAAFGMAGAAMAKPAQVLLAGRMVAPDGSLVEGMAIAVRDRRIVAVGPGDEYLEHGAVETTDDAMTGSAGPAGGALAPGRDADVTVIDRRDAVVSPGLIDVYSALGAYGHTVENVSAVDPGAAMSDALDLDDEHFRDALRAGVTAALVCPAPNNVAGGAAAVVRFGPDGRAQIAVDRGPQMFALGSSVESFAREPTSRMGAVHMLRQALAEARDGGGHPRLREYVRGRVGGLIVCQRAEDVSAALDVFREYGRLPWIVHTNDMADVAAEIANAYHQATVVVGPYGYDTPTRVLTGAAALHRAGAEVAFAAGLPRLPFDGLRRTAALAVRCGMDPAAARRAITVNASRVAGLEERCGAVAPGRDADLVVWSGDPLRLDSRVLEVYIKGVRVYDASLE